MAYNNWNQQNNFRDSSEVPQSKYNSALLKITRLNDSWSKCRHFWRDGDYVSLNEELKLVWLELVADATKEQQKTMREFRKQWIKILTEKEPLMRKKNIFNHLEKRWHFLFSVEKEQGLGKSYVNPEEDSWFA